MPVSETPLSEVSAPLKTPVPTHDLVESNRTTSSLTTYTPTLQWSPAWPPRMACFLFMGLQTRSSRGNFRRYLDIGGGWSGLRSLQGTLLDRAKLGATSPETATYSQGESHGHQWSGRRRLAVTSWAALVTPLSPPVVAGNAAGNGAGNAAAASPLSSPSLSPSLLSLLPALRLSHESWALLEGDKKAIWATSYLPHQSDAVVNEPPAPHGSRRQAL